MRPTDGTFEWAEDKQHVPTIRYFARKMACAAIDEMGFDGVLEKQCQHDVLMSEHCYLCDLYRDDDEDVPLKPGPQRPGTVATFEAHVARGTFERELRAEMIERVKKETVA